MLTVAIRDIKRKKASFLMALLSLITVLSQVDAAIAYTPNFELRSVTIEIGDYILDEGTSFEIPIQVVTNEADIGALTFSVFYDSSIISISDCSPSSALNALCNTNLDEKVIITGISAEGVSGELTFATLSGVVIGTEGQSTDLRIEVSQAADHTGSPIDDLTVLSGSLSLPESEPENNLPIISYPGDQTGFVGENADLTILATDVDIEDTLAFESQGLPDGLEINSSTGQITGTFAISGTTDVEIAVRDNRDGVATTTFSWTVIEPSTAPINTAPSITTPVTQTSAVGELVALTISAIDPDRGDTLEFSAVGLPQGLSLGSGSGEITGTATISGTNIVTITVSDGQDITSGTFIWIITEQPAESTNTPPSILTPLTQTHIVGTLVNLMLSATDPDAGDTLEYSAEGLPSGLTLSSIAGRITGTVTVSNTNVVTVTVSDGQSEARSTFTWIVSEPLTEEPPTGEPPENSNPVIQSPGAQNHEVGDTISLTLNATDADLGDVLSYGAGGLPVGLTFRPDTGLISGTVSRPGTYSVTVVVRDGKGGSDSVVFLWTVSGAETAPIVSTPEAQTIVTGQQVSLAITATDPNGQALRYTSDSLPAGLTLGAASGLIEGSVDTAGDYEVTITVTNESGEASVMTFSWRVQEPAVEPLPTDPPGGVNTQNVGGQFLPFTP